MKKEVIVEIELDDVVNFITEADNLEQAKIIEKVLWYFDGFGSYNRDMQIALINAELSKEAKEFLHTIAHWGDDLS